MHKALQIVRCDPSTTTGFAPSELLLGRKLVYPIEIKKRDIDFEGVEFTTPLVNALNQIHNRNFTKASKTICKQQQRYKASYDKRNNSKKFKLKVGDKVQYKRYLSKYTLSKKECSLWCPVNAYYLILGVEAEKKRVILQTPCGKKLSRSQPFDRIRKFRGKL